MGCLWNFDIFTIHKFYCSQREHWFKKIHMDNSLKCQCKCTSVTGFISFNVINNKTMTYGTRWNAIEKTWRSLHCRTSLKGLYNFNNVNIEIYGTLWKLKTGCANYNLELLLNYTLGHSTAYLTSLLRLCMDKTDLPWTKGELYVNM